MGKAVWRITAGVLPGEPMREYERVFCYTAADWEADRASSEGECSRFAAIQREAMEYARDLQNPRHVNWVQLEFCWY